MSSLEQFLFNQGVTSKDWGNEMWSMPACFHAVITNLVYACHSD